MLMKYLAMAALITSVSTASLAQTSGEVSPGTVTAPSGSGDQSGGDQDQDKDQLTSLSTVAGEVYDMDASAQGMIHPQQSRFFQRLIGALIGRVIGLAFHTRGYNWGDFYGSHSPYSHDEGRPVACFSESRRGNVYRGWSWTSARRAQERSFAACYWKNRECRPMGCEY
jgi:hypothetical protein